MHQVDDAMSTYSKAELREVILARLNDDAKSGVPHEGTAEILAQWVAAIVDGAVVRAREETAKAEQERKRNPWGLWNTDPIQKCWVSDDDGHYGSHAPKRFASREVAEEYAKRFGPHLEPRLIDETTPTGRDGC